MRIFRHILGVLSFVTASLLIGFLFFTKVPWPQELRDIYEIHTMHETGASNIVSAIYLGYRAYDTLGETIVLLVAVAGTLYLLRESQNSFSVNYIEGNEHIKNKAIRTNIVTVVASKLGPAIIVFGMYIMAFGYKSPGGGFQGGSVVASGIVILSFLFIENRSTFIKKIHQLQKLEIIAFVFLIVSFCGSIITGSLFLKNPFSTLQPVVYISVLNIIIGIKVGLNMGLLCIAMLRGEYYE